MGNEQTRQSKLKPTLGLFDATAVSVGAIVGGGIFVVTGIASGYAGSAIMISMLLAAVVASFTALSYAELTAWLPKEGSVYEYGRQLISPFAGYLTGWMFTLSNTFQGATVSLGFAYYFSAIFHSLPPSWIAATLCIVFTALNYFGIKQSARFNDLLVVSKLVILAFFCIFGLFYASVTNFLPFAPFQMGVLAGAYFIFFAYGGFGRVAVIAEEVKDAKKNVPRAIILSLAISTVFYIVVGAVAVGLVGSSRLASSNSPLAEAISITGNPLAIQIVTLGGLLATASVLLTSILGASRMAYAMARSKDLPRRLGQLHDRYNTPHYAIWATGFLMVAFVLLIDLSLVVSLSTFSLLFYYTSANISAIRMQKKDRLYHPVVPVLGAITCFVLLVFILFIASQTWIIGAAAMAIGTLYYIARKRAPPRKTMQNHKVH